ncbi:SDR family oxidoreductase [Streptomyces cinerochromogenes]|uniref:SDR family oxidoreductase n=1 Tax=Streptomyces cinerochromogenes TaxID=66422 RepID=UPI0036CFD336
MSVLIVGGSGFLGSELVRQATAAGHVTAATFTHRPGSIPDVSWHSLDLRYPQLLESAVAGLAPCVIINATSGGADWAVTAEGPVRLALVAVRHGCRLVHVSSDAVFSGASVHYDESRLPDPVTPYGAAKAAAETGVRLVDPDAVVARTSLIIGDRRSVHVRAVHDLASGRWDGALFTDDVRCPVHVSDLAAALLELGFSDASGVRHLAGAEPVSRYDLGVLIARRDGLDISRLRARRRSESGIPGGLDVRLDCRATQRELVTCLRGAREFLVEGINTPSSP